MNPHSRPVFLNLLRIRLPLNALVSIAHRISGVMLALSIPFFIYILERSLQSETGFVEVEALLRASFPIRLSMVLVCWAWVHHALAGIRYLLIDLDIGVSRASSRLSAWLVAGGGVLALLIAAGAWL